MNKETIIFEANEQTLTFVSGDQNYASNTVDYVEAVFRLGENWDFDVIIAVWQSKTQKIATVLGDGVCIVPTEVLAETGVVKVNLVGADIEDGEVVERLTTYPQFALLVDATAQVNGTETQPVTPSQFEQFIEIVKAEVEKVKDIDHVELNDDYTLTFYFSDGTEWTTPISIRGEQGEQGETGNGIASAVLNDDYTLTLTFTDGTSYTTSSIRGAQGEPGEVTLAQLASVLPTDTASGAIASFPDGSDLFDYLSCIVNIEPVQAGSGTPSPDNVRPITGWTGCEVDVSGVNLWSDKWSEYTQPNDYRVYPIKLEQGAKYTVSVSKVGSTVTGVSVGIVKSGDRYSNFVTPSPWVFVNNQGAVQTRTTYTIDATWTDPKLIIFATDETAFNSFFENYHIQIEKGLTATPYTPYNGTTYPVSWQTEAGTVYGGKLHIAIVDGEPKTWVTVDAIKANASDCSISLGGTSDPTKKRAYFYGLPNAVKSIDPTLVDGLLRCNVFEAITANRTYTRVEGISVSNNSNGVYAYKDDLQTVADWQTFIEANDMEFTYTLATPQTYQLDPVQVACLLEQNNVWADCGNVEVQYKADVQRWVEKMLNA